MLSRTPDLFTCTKFHAPKKEIVHCTEGSRLGEWKCRSDRGASCFLWWNSGLRPHFRSGVVVKSSQDITKESEAG